MTRFLYVADTHSGACPMRYQQQKGYPEKLPELIAALSKYILEDGEIDFVLHGGDMIDSVIDEHIIDAVRLFSALPVPLYLCLGNHDLTSSDAVNSWLKLAPDFFIDNEPNFLIKSRDCVIHVVPNHWCEHLHYWHDKQDAHFAEEQISLITHELDAVPELPHLILTHTPVYGLPEGQTGLTEPHHSPSPLFTESVIALLIKYPQVKCVLGAHNHMNMRVTRQNVEFVTASSMVETPFEFKLFEINSASIKMSTINLSQSLAFDGEYDQTKSFVQGRTCDREFFYHLGRKLSDKASAI